MDSFSIQVDWGGMAALIGATGGFLTVCVNLYLQIEARREQRRAKWDRDRIETKIDNIQTNVRP